MTEAEKVLSDRVTDKSNQYIAERRLNRKLTKDLKHLTECVSMYLKWLDAEMKKPSDAQRGGRIAKASNELELQNDIVRRFTPGIQS